MAKRPERLFQIVPALRKMRPPIGVDGYDGSEDSGSLDCVIRVHGEIELASRLRRSGEEQHKTGFEPPLYFGHAIEPNRVAGDVEGFEGMRFGRQDKADDIAGERFDPNRAMPGWGRRNVERAAISV